jgi:hypothetical protein
MMEQRTVRREGFACATNRDEITNDAFAVAALATTGGQAYIVGKGDQP